MRLRVIELILQPVEKCTRLYNTKVREETNAHRHLMDLKYQDEVYRLEIYFRFVNQVKDSRSHPIQQ